MGDNSGKMQSPTLREYLITSKYAIKLASSQYSGMVKIAGSDFHILEQLISPLEDVPKTAPKDCELACKLTEGEREFNDFLALWLNNAARLYRGFNGSHFCWPDMTKGKLVSEGEADIPTFTMGNTQKTRWLPMADYRSLAEDVAYSGTDTYTSTLSLTNNVPIGIAVCVPVGKSKGIPIAWLNAGEIVVRGPLMYPAFQICTIIWMQHGMPSKTNWPMGLSPDDLPPQRPYKPGTKKDIEDWWDDKCSKWVKSLVLAGHLVMVKRLKGG